MFLATSVPDAKIEDGRVIVEIPSGQQTVEISMSIHQAMAFGAVVHVRASDAMKAANIAAVSGEVLPFTKRKRAGRR